MNKWLTFVLVISLYLVVASADECKKKIYGCQNQKESNVGHSCVGCDE